MIVVKNLKETSIIKLVKQDYERSDNRVPLPFFENGMFIILYYNIEKNLEIKEDGEFKESCS